MRMPLTRMFLSVWKPRYSWISSLLVGKSFVCCAGASLVGPSSRSVWTSVCWGASSSGSSSIALNNLPPMRIELMGFQMAPFSTIWYLLPLRMTLLVAVPPVSGLSLVSVVEAKSGLEAPSSGVSLFTIGLSVLLFSTSIWEVVPSFGSSRWLVSSEAVVSRWSSWGRPGSSCSGASSSWTLFLVLSVEATVWGTSLSVRSVSFVAMLSFGLGSTWLSSGVESVYWDVGSMSVLTSGRSSYSNSELAGECWLFTMLGNQPSSSSDGSSSSRSGSSTGGR